MTSLAGNTIVKDEAKPAEIAELPNGGEEAACAGSHDGTVSGREKEGKEWNTVESRSCLQFLLLFRDMTFMNGFPRKTS